MAVSKDSSPRVPTGLFSLRHPGRRIWLSTTKSSGFSRGTSWSEEGLFLYLTAALRVMSNSPPGSESWGDEKTRANVVRLLGEWLKVCSLDTRRPH